MARCGCGAELKGRRRKCDGCKAGPNGDTTTPADDGDNPHAPARVSYREATT